MMMIGDQQIYAYFFGIGGFLCSGDSIIDRYDQTTSQILSGIDMLILDSIAIMDSMRQTDRHRMKIKKFTQTGIQYIACTDSIHIIIPKNHNFFLILKSTKKSLDCRFDVMQYRCRLSIGIVGRIEKILSSRFKILDAQESLDEWEFRMVA
jgi:hypothetical protein